MRCTILANGQWSQPAGLDLGRRQNELIIATDGGAVHCRTLGVTPDLLVGDMDSIPEGLLTELEAQGVEILRFPPRKDQTDLELAIELAIERGADDIVILAALGLRWDMSIAAVMLLASPRFAGVSLVLRDGATDILRLRGGQQLEIAGKPGDRLSIIPLGGPAVGVGLGGLAYPLSDQDIPLGSTLGVSNVLTRSPARVKLRQGQLLCIVEKLGEESRPTFP
jgi:thiamine pyrophosphokinase